MSVRIDFEEISPARVEGGTQNVFRTTKFVLVKPVWESDDSASACILCKSKFNQIRRKHHCRTCGKILCAKCCSNKVPLPQFNMDTVERVCNACMPVVTSVTMSHATDQQYHDRAVTSLEVICRENPCSVITLGGAQTLVYLSRIKNGRHLSILNKITTCLHTLSLHSGALAWFAQIGFIDALSHILHILSSTNDQSTMTSEALDTMRIYVKTSDNMKRIAVQSGCVAPLLELAESDNPFVSLVSMTTLSLIAECADNHVAILSPKNALRKLLVRIASSKDDKEVEIVLRMMMLMSAGSGETKHMIVCEDSSIGSGIASVFQTRVSSPQILANACCTIANLATSADDQVSLQNSVHALLGVLPYNLPGYVTIHCIRGLANFAKHELHVNVLLDKMPAIVQLLKPSFGSEINSHALRCVFNVLQYRIDDTVKAVDRSGSQTLLLRVAERESVMRDLLSSLDREAPPIATE